MYDQFERVWRVCVARFFLAMATKIMKESSMQEWTVHIEGLFETADEALAEKVIDELASYAPAVSYGHGRIGVTLSVIAATPQQAVFEAADAFARVIPTTVTRIEAEQAA
jgi:hypothetical protein